MENQESQPAPAVPVQPVATPTPKKTSPWVWILGGCLTIIILGMIAGGFIAWWGYHAAKDAIKENAPDMQEFKGSLDDINKQAEQWSQQADKMQKKADEMQNSLPAPQDKNDPGPRPY